MGHIPKIIDYITYGVIGLGVFDNWDNIKGVILFLIGVAAGGFKIWNEIQNIRTKRRNRRKPNRNV